MRRITIAPVPLHDVKDVVGVCKSLLQRAESRGWTPTDEQYEDALGHLLVEAVSMAAEYDPTKGISFSTYLGRFLPGRLVDWNRKEGGDRRNITQRPEHVPFDPVDDAHTAASFSGDDFVDQIIEAASFSQDAATLTSEGAWILENVAQPIARNESHDTVAANLGISRRKVARLLEQLRDELLAVPLGLDPHSSTDEILEALHVLDESPIDHPKKGAA